MTKAVVSEFLANAQRIADESRALADSIRARTAVRSELHLRPFGDASLGTYVECDKSDSRGAKLHALINSEISDFFAGFGSPGEPDSPCDAQLELIGRINTVFSEWQGVDLATTTDRTVYFSTTSGKGAGVFE